MATQHSTRTTEKGVGAVADTLADRIARSFTVGTDAEGYDHHYYQAADTVVVYDADGVDHREHLDGRPLEHWVGYVSEARGWQTMGQFADTGIAKDTERKEGGR